MVEINLLPQQYRKRSEPNVWLYAGVAAGVVTLLAIAIPEIVVATTIGNLQKRLDDQTGQISALQQSVAPEYRDLTTRQNNLNAVAQTARNLSSTKNGYWSTDLAKFVGQLPSGGGVALNQLTMHPFVPNPSAPAPYDGKPASKEFDLTGSAVSSTALVGFLNAYTQDNYGVNFKSTQRNAAANNYTFSATVGQLDSVSASATTPGTTPGATPANGVKQ
ncbi:fimbrial assembly protein [Deinococcus sp.]|uniref:fimbrial assembly protein n=1 Tax=Deinococcus sp. TaxID=47478 RepID=UPI0025DEA854|nr:fimbrial assembly protein [Deinococcus sp.]